MQDSPSNPPAHNGPITGSSPGSGPQQTPRRDPSRSPQTPAETPNSAWCVVLYDPPDDVDSDDALAHLARVLDDRRVDHRIAPNPYFAMAELVRHERERRASNHPQRPVILLITPSNHAHTPDSSQKSLVSGAKRVVPGLACWWYDPRTTPALCDFEGMLEASTPEIVTRPAAARAFTGAAHLRLAGDGHDAQVEDAQQDGQAPGEEQASRPDEALLSEEELRLLLGDDEDEQTQRQGRS